MTNCDKCGLDDSECKCYIYDLEKRVDDLEDFVDKLTQVVKAMSDFIKTHYKEKEREK